MYMHITYVRIFLYLYLCRHNHFVRPSLKSKCTLLVPGVQVPGCSLCNVPPGDTIHVPFVQFRGVFAQVNLVKSQIGKAPQEDSLQRGREGGGLLYSTRKLYSVVLQIWYLGSQRYRHDCMLIGILWRGFLLNMCNEGNK